MTGRNLPIVVEGFDWDVGNGAKCERHGLIRDEIEGIFQRPVLILPDKPNVSGERRFRAIGKTRDGRDAFVAFTFRQRDDKRLIRPISARYMHKKELKSYEATYPDLRNR